MAIRVTEVIRSEMEGGLAGPANPIPDESIDCGCAQLPCPRLARFATRRLFVGLLSWVGLIQAAAYAYLHMAGPTIARRFQFHPYAMGRNPLPSPPCKKGEIENRMPTNAFFSLLHRMGAHSFGPDAVRPRSGDRLLGRQDTQGGVDRRHCPATKHLVFRHDNTSLDPSHESG